MGCSWNMPCMLADMCTAHKHGRGYVWGVLVAGPAASVLQACVAILEYKNKYKNDFQQVHFVFEDECTEHEQAGGDGDLSKQQHSVVGSWLAVLLVVNP